MSFSADIKNELSKINNLKNKDEVYAEFLGYLVTANTNINEKNNTIKFSTENEYNINRFAKLLRNLNIDDYKINIIGKTFYIEIKDKEKKSKISIVDIEKVINSDNLRKAYIRGNFLGAGSINNPKNKYHLEIIFKDKECAEFSIKILKEFNINMKILEKTLYIKEGEEISNFLALIGANSAVLKFEEIRVLREMKNNVNRIVNCETANLNRTINTAIKQIEIIKKLKQLGKFNKLPKDLKEIANLREKRPDATLEELGKMLEKPIGKSSVSNRFKRIEEYL